MVHFLASEVPLCACTKPGEGLLLLCLVHDRTGIGVVDVQHEKREEYSNRIEANMTTMSSVS